ncbi:MAG TPA: PQQ-binding-like beta-propeller repeat protein, partial [Pseudonocardia sp.]|nr:PQQ-binding-like beta-propeller repeat protein [Pseudonocardia sp.]
ASWLAVSGGTVVLVSGQLGTTGVDAVTGAVRWQAPVGERGAASHDHAVISDGVVLVLGQDNQVHALEVSSGAQRWARPDTAAGGGTADRTPAAAAGVVYAANTGGRVYAIDLATGASRGDYLAAEQLSGVGVVAAQGGTVYLGGYLGTGVQAVDLR